MYLNEALVFTFLFYSEYTTNFDNLWIHHTVWGKFKLF